MKRVLICSEPHEGRVCVTEHPLERRIDVTDAESAAQAAESASRAFEALYGCPWKLHANLIEINADPDQLIETRSNIRAIWPS